MTDLPGKFRPPGPLRIGDNFKLEDWQKWLKTYRWYAGATNLANKSPDEQLSTLKAIVGSKALEVWRNFSVSETLDVESVLKKFEDLFTPKLNVPLERLNFNRLQQRVGQCFDDFLSAAISQVDKCNFGEMRDDFLRDKIVAGIDDEELRTRLLSETDLTYEKAVQMCRSSAKKQFLWVSEDGNLKVDDGVSSNVVSELKGVRPDRRRKKKASDYDSDEKPFACEIAVCTFMTSHQKSLDRHMKIHKGEKRHSCTVCNYKSAVRSNVTDHMKTHSGEKPFECHHCGFKCALKGYIRNHLKVHMSEKPFACSECDYKSNRLESLNRHKLRHTGEKPFACEFCDFRCSQKSSLKIHMRGHTGERPYACNECDYRCIVPEKLRIHRMRCHTGEKPYACDFCDIGFADQGSLRQHRRTHTGERPYACDVCDYKCALRGNLRKHMMRHTGEKPYACHVCEYRGAQPGSLKAHLKTHTGEKPNVCDICGHRCAHKGNLKKHMLTHTGERPYACPICPYRSAQSSGLKTHMKTHTGEKPYVCHMCGFRCAHNGNLKQHMKTHVKAESEVTGWGQGSWPETYPAMTQPDCGDSSVFEPTMLEMNHAVPNSLIPNNHHEMTTNTSHAETPNTHPMLSNLLLPDHTVPSAPLADNMLHDNQVPSMHRAISVPSGTHQSPFHHPYTCQNSHGLPT